MNFVLAFIVIWTGAKGERWSVSLPNLPAACEKAKERPGAEVFEARMHQIQYCEMEVDGCKSPPAATRQVKCKWIAPREIVERKFLEGHWEE